MYEVASNRGVFTFAFIIFITAQGRVRGGSDGSASTGPTRASLLRTVFKLN